MSGGGPVHGAAPTERVGFHEGELAVQRRAGVRAEAARLGGMVERGYLRGGLARFLADRTFAALAARDASGRLWVSPLTGPPGFLAAADPGTLAVGAAPEAGDPLFALPAGQPAGVVVIDFATRRRVRINGVVAAAGARGLRIAVDQAYGNCPQYIQRRTLEPVTAPPAERAAAARSRTLSAQDIALVERADTVFIGTAHPTRGADASHRGGPPGFVRVAGTGLWWPDYRGNGMFNTLGNLAVDPAAAVLVPDFATGDTVQLSGTAHTDWVGTGTAGDDDGTGRLVRFAVHEVVSGRALSARAGSVEPYAHNPPLIG